MPWPRFNIDGGMERLVELGRTGADLAEASYSRQGDAQPGST
ncbi:MAG: hypothetical protein ACRDPR_00185 [Nocardioidaceae bacterium]